MARRSACWPSTAPGVVYLPLDLVEEDLAAGRLVRLFPDWQMPDLPIHTLHPSRHLVPRRITALIEAIAEGVPLGRPCHRIHLGGGGDGGLGPRLEAGEATGDGGAAHGHLEGQAGVEGGGEVAAEGVAGAPRYRRE